jgi:hypothetical protein
MIFCYHEDRFSSSKQHNIKLVVAMAAFRISKEARMISERYKALFANEDEVKKLTQQILRDGFAVLPEFFDDRTNDTLIAYSRSLQGNDRYKIARVTGTPAMNVARSPEFIRIFDSIHKARCELQNVPYKPLDPTQQAVSLPIAIGGVNADSVPFHFDHSFVNAVYAMQMPPNSGDGNLLIYNNFRGRVRPHVLSRIVARLIRHSRLLQTIFPPREVSYRERGLHLFFGDITLHAVKPFQTGERMSFTINASRVVRPTDETLTAATS